MSFREKLAIDLIGDGNEMTTKLTGMFVRFNRVQLSDSIFCRIIEVPLS
jgi:hypothetical protein